MARAVLVLVSVLSLIPSCGTGTLETARGPSRPLFREVARETGLHFQYFTGATGDYYLPEITGAGVAVFDYDNDGDLDV